MDLAARQAAHRKKYLRAIAEVIKSGDFAGGPFVDRFEQKFAHYCGTRFAVGVASGTDALWLALLALGIGPNDEVITVPMTFASTVEAIRLTGARPVLIDIDPVTYTMDPSKLERVINNRTKAILPVHLFGHPADMPAIMKIARNNKIPVIEDAAQAHGAEYAGQRVGSFGNAGCFSFYPGKNLGALGEAGAVTTDDETLARRLRALREHGQFVKFDHQIFGWNARMDAIQAAVLAVKLSCLEEWNQIRNQHAIHYNLALAEISNLVLPYQGYNTKHAWHIYAVRVQQRETLQEHLRNHEVEFGLHYPIPIHLQPACQYLGYQCGDFPVSELYANELLSLPCGPELNEKKINLVIKALKKWDDNQSQVSASVKKCAGLSSKTPQKNQHTLQQNAEF